VGALRAQITLASGRNCHEGASDIRPLEAKDHRIGGLWSGYQSFYRLSIQVTYLSTIPIFRIIQIPASLHGV
jgi:hypothetical protein